MFRPFKVVLLGDDYTSKGQVHILFPAEVI